MSYFPRAMPDTLTKKPTDLAVGFNFLNLKSEFWIGWPTSSEVGNTMTTIRYGCGYPAFIIAPPRLKTWATLTLKNWPTRLVGHFDFLLVVSAPAAEQARAHQEV